MNCNFSILLNTIQLVLDVKLFYYIYEFCFDITKINTIKELAYLLVATSELSMMKSIIKKKVIVSIMGSLALITAIFTAVQINEEPQEVQQASSPSVKQRASHDTAVEKEDAISKTAAKISSPEKKEVYSAHAVENKLTRAAQSYAKTQDAKTYYTPEQIVLLLKQYHQDVTENVNTYPEAVDGSLQVVENVLTSGDLTAVQAKFLQHYHATLTVMNDKLGHEKNWEQREATYQEISVYGDEMKKIRTKAEKSIGNFELFTQYEHHELFS